MRRLVVLTAALSLVAFAGTAAAGRAGGPPPFPQFVGAWSHAEINVTIRHQPHTLILDRGRLVQISATQLTLREADGTTQVVPLGPSTIFTGVRVRRNAPLRAPLRRALFAETMRIDGGTAVRVRVSLRP